MGGQDGWTGWLDSMGGQDGWNSCVANGLFITVDMGKTLTCVYRRLAATGLVWQVTEPEWQFLISRHASVRYTV